jgi:hypothetical protein
VTLLGQRFQLSMDGKRVFDEADRGKESILRPAHLRWHEAESERFFELGLFWPNEAGPGISITVTPTPPEQPS